MTRIVEDTNQFRKDLKKVKKQSKDLGKLKQIVTLLGNDQRLPIKYKDHALSGDKKGVCGCHIEPDWLLLYSKDDEQNLLRLERTGSHSNLFRWGSCRSSRIPLVVLLNPRLCYETPLAFWRELPGRVDRCFLASTCWSNGELECWIASFPFAVAATQLACFLCAYRRYLSFLIQPPANGWDPSGILI